MRHDRSCCVETCARRWLNDREKLAEIAGKKRNDRNVCIVIVHEIAMQTKFTFATNVGYGVPLKLDTYQSP